MSFFVLPPSSGGAPVVPGEQSFFANLSTLAQAVVKASPGRVFSVACDNTTGPTKYLQLHNLTGVIPVAAVPRATFKVPAASLVIVGSDFFGPPFATSPVLGGLPFSDGIAWGWSTTENTFTAAPAASQVTQILFQ